MIRRDNAEIRKLAASIVAKGGLIAFRTDTFYGLGVDPFNANAVARIKRLKGREEGKPILLLISDIGDTERLLQSKSAAFEHFSKRFWPGPLTIVAPAVSELPLDITAGTETVGVRLPDDENVRLLVRACGGRLTATSANLSGCEPAKSASEVQNYFQNGIDLIVDGGEVTVTKPSTVIDIVEVPPKVVREGAISKAELERASRLLRHS
ncbi:MAG TPA: L-threonylcarbamoyladenylate synthase [Pyrinomonadaceae bacterium]|jgi:Sua5/YciO/YrdC/YwlC family protein|nr:L-threonylcarbamoyladenylate synthase [Pyrinomonadaceae bacterium]